MRIARSLLAALISAPVVAGAADGVLEINQTCAAVGCFAGDAAGLPVTITLAAPARSFRLTSDLALQSAATTGIQVTATGVAIDLGGFAISGRTTCTGNPVTSCSPLGAGVGVIGGSLVAVRNGSIIGMGDDGVRLDFSSRVEGVTVLHSGDDGLDLGDENIARGNIITGNGGTGIRCNSQCVVAENTANGNGSDGIVVPSGSVVGNTATNNAGRGGLFGADTTFAYNVFARNFPPDQSGGHAAGGNRCADRSCSNRGARRYYLSQGEQSGLFATAGCAARFHFASLWELFDLASLEYDTARGRGTSDSGEGAPAGVFGWIRTGGNPGGASAAGDANCLNWASSAGNGTIVALDDFWSDGNAVLPTDLPPWTPATSDCSVPTPVWCVED